MANPNLLSKKLANALFNLQPELVEKLLTGFPDGSTIPWCCGLPVYYITRFIDIALDKLECYTESDRPTIAKAFIKNDAIKEMLINKFGVNFNEPISFYELGKDGYFSPWNYEGDGYNDVFGTEDVTCLKSLGASDLDIELYCEVMKFNFDKVKRLLIQGAKPDAEIWNEDYDFTEEPTTAISEIGQEIIGLPHVFDTSYLYDEKEPQKNLDHNLYFLTSLAAHTEMYNLLIPYCKEE